MKRTASEPGLKGLTEFCDRVCFARDEVVVFAGIVAMLSVTPPSRAPAVTSLSRFPVQLAGETRGDSWGLERKQRGTILPFNHLICSYYSCRGKKYLYRHSRYKQVFMHTMYSFSSGFCAFFVPAFINAFFNVFVGLLLLTPRATSVSIIRRGIVVQIG